MTMIPPIKYNTYHSKNGRFACVVKDIHRCKKITEEHPDAYVVEVYCRKGGESSDSNIFIDCFYETSFFDFWDYVGDTGWDAEKEYQSQKKPHTKVNSNA